MAAFYEVWDDTTANRLGEFETLDDARALLWAILRESGSDAVSSLAVLAYTGQDSDAEPFDVATVLEGADFVAQMHDGAARPAS